METYNIDTNIPIPTARQGRVDKLMHTLLALRVGESFLAPKDIKRETLASRCSNAKKYNITCALRMTKEGLRVWRIK